MEEQPTRAVRQRLESLARAGVATIPKVRRAAAAPAAPAPAPAAARPVEAVSARDAAEVRRPPPPPIMQEAMPQDERLMQLDAIRREVAQCLRCQELCLTRTQTVFGVGNPRARLCFLGEAPGADEDRLGEPFVGRAGQLLTKIIEACTLRREDVYILNVLKCRPPGNRRPEPDEAANCREFLDRQLAVVQPEFLCCLGATAAQSLLETTTPISQMRGRWFDYRGIRVMCTFHPSYLLRNPAAKKDTWEDMKWLMRHMGIDLEAKKA